MAPTVGIQNVEEAESTLYRILSRRIIQWSTDNSPHYVVAVLIPLSITYIVRDARVRVT